MKALLVVLAAAWLGCGGEDSDPFVVQLDTGQVRGTAQGETRMFRGIPFAAPPIGEHRWRSPQPAESWEGVIDTIEVGSACPQNATPLGEQSNDEDCLYLNVWTPNGARNLPVLVWIHGGGFAIGTGGSDFYNGQLLAETQDVIIVTVNYRLGPLGFFAHPELEGGNFGLEDQIASLEWVQRNIAAFGGDPTKVTIFGESAGGMSTCLLYVSPRTSGLFHAVISQSGLCSDDTLLPTRGEAFATSAQIAEAIGCTDLACLHDKSAAELLAGTAGTPVGEQLPGGLFFQPPTDPLTLPFVDDDIVTASARVAFESGDYEPRPLLLGSNKDEGTLFVIELLGNPPTTDQELRDALARRFDSADVDAIIAMYPSAASSFGTAIAEIATDAFFTCPARRAARGAMAAGASVYLYSFERPLEAPISAGIGATHAGEIPFVFGSDFLLGRVGAGQPTAVAMQGFWAQFAATGDPGAEWPIYDASDTLMVLDNVPTTRAGHKAALCDFWDSL